MSRHSRRLIVFGLTLIVLFMLASCATPPASPATAAQAPSLQKTAGTSATARLEIFSPWTTGGEAAGLLKLYDLYKQDHTNVEIINATVAGGSGSNAEAVLKTRLLSGDPPDSFQVRMGRELIDPWAASGYMDNLDELYKSEGWDKSFPQGVLDILSWDGHYWSVPVNIHRANVLWYNKKIFADNNLQPPKTMDDFVRVAEALKAKGITPLALGDTSIWASTQLFETVLIGTLGPDKYKGLWTGQTDWMSSEVKQALDNFKTMLSYVNQDHSSLSWSQANDLVLTGQAAMTIMGDWVDADNLAKNKTDVEAWAPAPGNGGIFDAASDTFGLTKQVIDRQNTIDWLKLVGSRRGQEAFNPVSGAICARTDCDPTLFDPYRQSAMQDWTKNTIVPSLAQDSAASEAWVTAIHGSIAVFVGKRDIAITQNSLAKACADAGVCR